MDTAPAPHFMFFGGACGILGLIVVLILSIFWIWMLIDCLTSNLPPNEKLLWFLVILFLHLLGAILYYFLRRTPPAPGP